MHHHEEPMLVKLGLFQIEEKKGRHLPTHHVVL
jgi:hypothetical protein